MSTEAIAHAFGQRLPGTEKWVLVCLARYADEWGYSVFPALDELADKTGFSAATCKRTLRELITLNRVRRIARATPVSPAFYQIVGVPEPEEPKPTERHCPSALRRAVLYEFGERCEYCGQAGTKELGPDGKTWCIDRVVPGLRGGTYSPDNVTLCCRSCNSKKKSKPAPAGTRTLSMLQESPERGVQSAPPPQGSASAPGGCNADPGTDPDAPREGSLCAPGGSRPDPDLSDLFRTSDQVSRSAEPAAPAPKQRPRYSGQRVIVFDWQHEKCRRILGPLADEFDLDAWYRALDAATAKLREVVPERDNGAWLESRLLDEARRRRLTIATAESPREQQLRAQRAGPEYSEWTCPHVTPCSNRMMCRTATQLGRPERMTS